MNTPEPPHKSYAARLLAAPLVVTLLSVALLLGYAGSRRVAALAADRSVARQVVLFDPARSAFHFVGDQDAAANVPDGSSDPVENYLTALKLLKDDYYGAPIDEKKVRQLTYDAVRGMLLSLQDPFTSFMDPDEWTQFQATTTRGDFEGIGALLQEEKPNIVVEEPIETGPAEKDGVKAGDIITRVDGKSIVGMNIDDAVKLIKGPAGTPVTITVVRDKKTLNFTIVRARVEPPVVKYWMEDPKNKIGRIVLEEFNEKSMDQMNKAFSALQKQGMRGLIFDLRYDPGGLLDVAVQVASVFIPKNSVPALKNDAVIIHEGSGKEHARLLEQVDTTYRRRLPLAVLVNDGSASASEIVSGAIKDYGAGTLIGQRTFGKGCVQTLFPLDDNSCLRLTTALYYPPRHYDINYKQDENHNRIPGTGGLVPDIPIMQAKSWKADTFLTDKDAANDTQLQAALDFERKRLAGDSTAEAIRAVDADYHASNARIAAAEHPAGNPYGPSGDPLGSAAGKSASPR